MSVHESTVLRYGAGMLTMRRRAIPAHFVNLTICELVVRATTHIGWEWTGVELLEGEELR